MVSVFKRRASGIIGHVGICYRWGRKKPWEVKFKRKGRTIHCGCYPTYHDAEPIAREFLEKERQ